MTYVRVPSKSTVSLRREPPSNSEPPSPTAVVAQDASSPAVAPRSQPAGSQPTGSANQWTAEQKLAYLRERNIGRCQRCVLSQTRRNIVFGVGSACADIMFVGEAPGADEDRRGEPFVGRAGQKLDRWIEALGLRREQVYIANVLKCRPPKNRDPKPEEVEKCSPFLKAQIRAIQPKVLVALGRHAGGLLSQRPTASLGSMRSARDMTYDASGPKESAGSRQIPLVVTYHPAYVLRQERGQQDGRAEALVLEDLHRALDLSRSQRDQTPC